MRYSIQSIIRLIVPLSVMFFATGANAFVIDVRTQDLAANIADLCSDSTTSSTSLECTSGPSSFNTATASGLGSANAVTGALRALATGTADNATDEGSISAIGQANLGETFTVSGTGTVTALFGLTGEWDVFRIGDLIPGFQAQARLEIHRGTTANGTLIAFDQFVENATATGSVNDILSVDFNVSDGDNFFVNTSLLAQISNGQGSVDFSHTGEVFFETSQGVSLTFGDQRFLTDPAFLSRNAVPEPGMASLLAAGLIGLAVLRRRRGTA